MSAQMAIGSCLETVIGEPNHVARLGEYSTWYVRFELALQVRRTSFSAGNGFNIGSTKERGTNPARCKPRCTSGFCIKRCHTRWVR